MIDLKKQVEITKKVDRFLSELSDSAKELYLLAFSTIIIKLLDLINLLGVREELLQSLSHNETLALSESLNFLDAIKKIQEDV